MGVAKIANMGDCTAKGLGRHGRQTGDTGTPGTKLLQLLLLPPPQPGLVGLFETTKDESKFIIEINFHRSLHCLKERRTGQRCEVLFEGAKD